ncbi:hypothetical protein [Ferruginibacter albus]|uniref:hypothetical protein n=1 Tax=Ferruginibacter albus TaxID=2875540 RepID=UPI001CC4262F|nr:hypothetical protein [Ferruginibacter albus]UAY50712.1 hypothetical protein K9M53_08900 [Ferruginibacter albus]
MKRKLRGFGISNSYPLRGGGIYSFITFLLIFFSSSSFGQTTVFSDNFNRASVTTGAPATYTISQETGKTLAWSDNGSILIGTSTSSGSTASNVTAPLSSFSSPFNATLSSNPGLVTWSINMAPFSKKTTGAYNNGGKYFQGLILATTGTNAFILSTGVNGYAIVNQGNGSGQSWEFVKFTGGLKNNSGSTVTTLATFNTSSVATSWVDIKITYNPATGIWTFYFNDEVNTSATPTNDPAAFAYTQSLTSNDATYTGTLMTSFGYLMAAAGESGKTYYFDNFTCTVASSCAASITTQPANTSAICPGAGVTTTFSASATGVTDYQWQVNKGASWVDTGSLVTASSIGNLVVNVNSSSLNGYKYRVKLNSGCVISNEAILNVNTLPAITTQPAGSTVCSGSGTANFIVVASGTGTLSYAWQESADNGVTWSSNLTDVGIYSGTSTSTLALTNATTAKSGYRYRVTVTGTCSPIAQSNGSATLTFTTAPAITTPPSSASVICAGSGTSTFTVAASGGGTLTYTWKESTDGGVTWGSALTNTGVYSGTGTATLTITNPPATMNGYQYQVTVSNCTGNATSSSTAILNVAAALAITGQPVNITMSPGWTKSFSVTTSGTVSNYKWQYSANGTSGWNDLPGSFPNANFSYSVSTSGNVNTLIVTTNISAVASASTTYYYRCLVDNGSCTLTSNVANLQVVYPDPIITSISPSSITEGSGSFTLLVSGSNFVNGVSTVYWNSTALTTVSWTDSTQISATVPASLIVSGTGGTTPSIVVKTTGAVNNSNATLFTIIAAGDRFCTAVSPWIFTIDNSVGMTNTGLNFVSFTDAINSLNACASARTHPVTFKVKAGAVFNETPPAITIAQATSAANTVTFVTDGSSSVHPTILAAAGTSGSSDPIITIQGTNYIIFDGIDLKSTNTTIDFGYYLITNSNNSSATKGAQNNIIRNCKITLNKTNSNKTYGIYQLGNGGVVNSGNTYYADTVYNSYHGIYLTGVASPLDNGNAVQNCTIGPAINNSNDNIGGTNGSTYPIYSFNQNGITISGNTVQNILLNYAATMYGIYVVGAGTGTTSIYNNKIHDLTNQSTSSSAGVYGLYVKPAAGTITNIFTNCISGIYNNASTSSLKTIAMYFDGPTSGTNATGNVYFNSVWLSGGYSHKVTCFYTQGTKTALNINENIFKYSGSQVVTTNKTYCIYLNDGSSVLNTEDYNIYDMISTTSPYFVGYNNSASTKDAAILTAWKNSTGKDVNSRQFFTTFVSTADLHLADYPSNSYYGLLSDVSAISPSTDIDGEARTVPIIGADEVSITSSAIVAISAPSQPVAANIAKGNTDQLIGQYSLVSHAATAGSNAQPIFTGLTLKVHTVGTSTTNTDYSNFKLNLYDASTGTTIGQIASYTPAISFDATKHATITFNFSSTQTLSDGDQYYVYVTCDVSTTAQNGSNINVDSSYAANFSFVPDAGVTPVTKIAPAVIDTAGRQTVCTFYYNTAMLDVSNPNFSSVPSSSSTNVDELRAWRASKTNTGPGMGGTPSSFTADYQVFNIIRQGATFSSPTATWNLSGDFSKAVVGDASASDAILFTIPAGNAVSDTIDVNLKDTLRLYNTKINLVANSPEPATDSLSLGVLVDGSVVDFASTSTQVMPAVNYGTLMLSGTGNRTFMPGTTGIKNNLSLLGTGVIDASTSTINFNGTSQQQYIPGIGKGITYHNLVVSNSSGSKTQVGENNPAAESVVIDNTLTVTKNLLIPQNDSIILKSTVTSVNATSSTGLLEVNGALVNNAIGQIFLSASNTIQVNNGGVFELRTPDNTDNGITQIPIANWLSNSTCLITGIIGTSGNDYKGLDGNYQTFGNVKVDCQNLVGKLLLTNATYGGFSANTLIVQNTGSNPSSKTGYVQISRESVQESVNVNSYLQESGYVALANNISGGGSRSFFVAGDFIVKDSLPTIYPSKFEIMKTTGSTKWYGKLAVGGTFNMAATSTLVGTPYSGSGSSQRAELVFNGASSNQTATFGIVSGRVNFEIDKAQFAGGNDTVKLQNDIAADSFYLSRGVFAIGGHTLTVNNSISYANSTGTGTFGGSQSSNLVIGSTNATANAAGIMKFATNTVGSPYNNYLQNLTLYSSATATLGNALNINAGTSASPGTVTIGNSSVGLTTGGFLTLKSNINGTARIAPNTTGATNYISGDVIVERFIDNYRAWRLLSVPVKTSSQSINQAWQEGATNLVTNPTVNPKSGFGTEITCTIATSPSATGYDKAVTNNKSILYYDLSTLQWVAPNNTNSTNIASHSAYMIFIRGDRSVVVTTPPFNPSTTTVLRTTGGLNQGSVPVNLITGYNLIGNPYASQLNLDNILSAHSAVAGTNYTVWDPKGGHNNVGYYTYTAYISPGVYSSWNVAPQSAFVQGKIESGQAFFLNGSSSTFNIDETDKSSNSAMVFRPVGSDVAEFAMQLSTVNADGTTDINDGALSLFSSSYSDGVNWLEDAQKIPNPGENLAIVRSTKSIAIDKTTELTATDTIFLSLKGTSQKTYQFAFFSKNLAKTGLVGILQDAFTGQQTFIVLSDGDTTKVNIAITSNTASQVTNRFRIVFGFPDGGPLPVTFTSINASKQDKNIAVQWNVENELNIKEYVVEKSADGKTFEPIGTVKADGASIYDILDTKVSADVNYYRVHSVSNDGTIAYTQIVRVATGAASDISIYANPIKNGQIGLKLTSLSKGVYTLRLTNTLGQEILKTSISHPGGSALQIIPFSNAAKGAYWLQIIYPNGIKSSLKVLSE